MGGLSVLGVMWCVGTWAEPHGRGGGEMGGGPPTFSTDEGFKALVPGARVVEVS